MIKQSANPHLDMALRKISGNASAPKRAITDFFAPQKRHRPDDVKPTSLSSLHIPAEAATEASVSHDFDIWEDKETPLVCDNNQQLVSELDESARLVQVPVKDSNGLIRIGPQPIPAHATTVLSAPRAYIEAMLRRTVFRNGVNSDSKLPDADLPNLNQWSRQLHEELLQTMV